MRGLLNKIRLWLKNVHESKIFFGVNDGGIHGSNNSCQQ